MFTHIVVPLDGSQLAECVLPHLVAIAGHDNTKVSLIRVLEIERESVGEGPIDPLDWRINRAEAEAYIERVAEAVRQVGLDVETALLEGSAAERIIEYAQGVNADLIMVNSHGKSGVSRWNVSSVVRKIVQSARASIMLVRAYTCKPVELGLLQYGRILVPLDGSLRAEVALTAAAQLAQAQRAELVVTHILHKPELIQRVPLSSEDQELLNQIMERSRDAALRYMDQLRARLPVEFATQLHVSNNVSNTLQKIVDENNIDLIVLSAHGHSADATRSFGNVTASLIEYGSVPMISIQDLSPEEVEPTRAEEASREHRGH